MLMVLAVILAALLIVFLLVRHHVGVPFLAMVAGLAIYNQFGVFFAEYLHRFSPHIEVTIAKTVIYVALVALFPLLLYMRTGRSGLFGVLRYVEACIFAGVLVVLMSGVLAEIFNFDPLAYQIANYLAEIKGILLAAGVCFAYVDIFFYHAN